MITQLALTKLVDYDGKKYVFKKYMSNHLFKRSAREGEEFNMSLVEDIKTYLDCDTVITDQTGFIFLETVPDAEIIE